MVAVPSFYNSGYLIKGSNTVQLDSIYQTVFITFKLNLENCVAAHTLNFNILITLPPKKHPGCPLRESYNPTNSTKTEGKRY